MGMEFQREVCERLPLADVVMRLGQFVLREQHLSDVFEMHRDRSYEKVITKAERTSVWRQAGRRDGSANRIDARHGRRPLWRNQ